jgi:hypothetical protein
MVAELIEQMSADWMGGVKSPTEQNIHWYLKSYVFGRNDA